MTAVMALAGCGRPPAIERALTHPEQCHLIPVSVSAPDLITVALLDGVQPEYAPWPHNDGERLLFHHLYETLVTIDCLGALQPGLATNWEREHGGRRWTFELRRDARFWDDSPVTAGDVVRCWQDAVTVHSGIDSAQAVDDRTVRVFVNPRQRAVPRELTSRAFAVSKQRTNSRWPLGTGPYQVTETYGGMVSASLCGGDKPQLQFRTIRAREARDLLESTVDMLVTSHPEVIEYAAERPQLVTTPLPWNRTYVLISVTRIEKQQQGERIENVSVEFGERMARDAVRGDARGYASPAWWEHMPRCNSSERATQKPRAAQSNARRIIYDRADRTARDLAERIIALSATDPTLSNDAAAIIGAVPGLSGDHGGMVAQGVTAAELALNLREGDEFAYIIALRHRPADPCYEAARLLKNVPWLSAPGSDLADLMVPLVDARPHAIVRRDRFGLIVDWYGDPLIVNGK